MSHPAGHAAAFMIGVHWGSIKSRNPRLVSLPKRKKEKPPFGNECARKDEHVRAESNVNTAVVYDTHTDKSLPKQSLGLKTK